MHPRRRRAGVLTGAALALASTVLGAGCGTPTQAVDRCQSAPDEITRAIQARVTADGTLRNAKLVSPADGAYTFVSAEIHLRSAAPHDKGVIGTWATKDTDRADAFVAVDTHARQQSRWPAASFTVTADGAIESRACTALNRGKTRAQLRCEQARAAGETLRLPGGKDCRDR
jgi:hypothetical protein